MESNGDEVRVSMVDDSRHDVPELTEDQVLCGVQSYKMGTSDTVIVWVDNGGEVISFEFDSREMVDYHIESLQRMADKAFPRDTKS